MLTELQASRIRGHLGYGDFSGSQWLEFRENVQLETLTPLVVLQLVGRPPDNPESGARRVFFGEDLCEVGSILDEVEKAWVLMSTDTIENSQKVVQAGSVTLRLDEQGARERLYRYWCKRLALVAGVVYMGSPGSVGY